MPAYNFQQRFANLVEDGRKKQTIRALRKDRRTPKVGQLFVGYTGMRTKVCRQLLTSSIMKVQRFGIVAGEFYVDTQLLTTEAAHALAIADGFSSANEMLGWFIDQHGRTFNGHIIHWR
jgi:hypothetical protein